MEIKLDAEKFYERAERLQTDWLTHKSSRWDNSDALCIPFGKVDDNAYSKSSSFHLHMFGYEFTDSVILMTKNNFYFMATAKKCAYLESSLVGKHESIHVHMLIRTKDEAANREHYNTMAAAVRKGGGKRVGTLMKGVYQGQFIPSWFDFLEQSQLEKIEIASPLGAFFAVKDEHELEMCKRAAILSNKIMKHGFVKEMEQILDTDSKKNHEEISEHVENIIKDPTKIGIKIAQDIVDPCFAPIVQSGGVYDIKPSASSNTDLLKPDVIICSLGARYKSYCANISRTFLVDAPKKVENCYATLLGLYNACLEQMYTGNELKSVMEAAKKYLQERDAALLQHLPKNLGFAVGIEFRDATMLLNGTNSTVFKPGMIFNLSVGFHNIPLSDADKQGSPDAIQQLSLFSLLVADVVVVQKEGLPDLFTKASKEFGEVSYNIGDKDGQDEDAQSGDDDEGSDAGGQDNDVRRSRRAQEVKAVSESAQAQRQQRQQEIMKLKFEEARQRIQREATRGAGDDGDEELAPAKDLHVYRSVEQVSDKVGSQQNRVVLDKANEGLILPIGGRMVPVHISMIKNITNPDPDMRINFYTSGVSLGKECSKNVRQLVAKYGDTAVFIKELTFRSLDGRNLPEVYKGFQELRREIRQRELKAEQMKGLKVQDKLQKIKDQRIPRLQEVTMRPQLSGRKCVGTLEAHQNGMRFVSSRNEVLDVMYNNVKHAIFQPCDKTTMVLVHFHLKDYIIINKKQQRDVQFYTEVVESSMNLENSKRASWDPDELEEENRERKMRAQLNMAFKEFCTKVEGVASHYRHSIKIDVPFKRSAFLGNWSKEMVLLQPTAQCLVNLTEWPPFVATLSEIEHVHFERVTYATKAFDMTLIFKDWAVAPRTITAIETKFMDGLQDWLNLVELTYTKGPRTINWGEVMKAVKSDRDIFFDDTDDNGEPKPPGWMFLSIEEADDSDEEGDEESSYGDASGSTEESESEDSEESDFTEESESDYDEEEEDALEEKGQDWDELEKEASHADRKRKSEEMMEQARREATGARGGGGGAKRRR